MSLYSLGLASGGVVVHPVLTEVSDRALALHQGSGMVRTAEKRFYRRGLTVGAETPGVVGSFVDTIVGLILDIAHVLLLGGGILLLWRGLAG